jgi:beta-galactosidase
VALRRAIWACALSLLAGALAGCSPGPALGGQATLRPTLELRQVDGGPVVFESGQPVPDFGVQPRPRIDLDGPWRFQAAPLDDRLSFGDRRMTLAGLRSEAGDRLEAAYDDSGWASLQVPGSFDPPPAGRVRGGWYRRTFEVPAGWPDHSLLKFGSADYLADVWLNGRYLGYHEGGNTAFALDAGWALNRHGVNTLLVRVSRPPLGTRLDLDPWGLTDWWTYGGITGDVWLEAQPDLSAVRADVVPHLDGADVRIVLANRGPPVDDPVLRVEVLSAAVTDDNLLNPDPRSLISPGSSPPFEESLGLGPIGGQAVKRLDAPFVIRDPDLWSPARPALYVLHVALLVGSHIEDELYESFGLRSIRVDPEGPSLLLNGTPVAFHGVALHDEKVSPAVGSLPAGGPATDVRSYQAQLVQASQVNADLIRADHTPPNPLLLTLTDRLGFAVWEEIPLYHYTPQTFQIAMQRGIPQQMLAEMALRDFDHPSVLFHGFANEPQGGAERVSALTTLRDLDRRLDGTRLTGQAAYGYDPKDPTSEPLDVAGFTFYYGVFYGGALNAQNVRSALARMHATYPKKPLMILEFGRWSDDAAQDADQRQVFDVTYGQMKEVLDTEPGGYVGAGVWWSLNDYWTERPGIQVEHFGLYRPDGSARPVQGAVAAAYALGERPPGLPSGRQPPSGGEAVAAAPIDRGPGLLPLLIYALGVPTLILGAAVILLAWAPRVARPHGAR